jgi:hypothetical protein
MKRALLFGIGMLVSLVVLSGCTDDHAANPDGGLQEPAWKDPLHTTVGFTEYSPRNSSSYTAYAQNEKTVYGYIPDAPAFKQFMAYTPQPWDSTVIADLLFETRYGVLVSDLWLNAKADYFVEGVYLYDSTLYVNYQRTLYPVQSSENTQYRSYLFVLIQKNSADTIVLVENNREIKNYAVLK